MTSPEPLTRADVSDFAGRILGARLVSVAYHYLPAASENQYEGSRSGLDSDIAAVVLGFDSGRTQAITWAMEGQLEAIGATRDQQSYAGAADKVVDRSDSPGWSRYVGEVIACVAGAWHVSGDDCPESVWALRLDFSAGSVVLALGVADGEIEYMPDELVAIFDPQLAHAYRPSHAPESAWGTPLR